MRDNGVDPDAPRKNAPRQMLPKTKCSLEKNAPRKKCSLKKNAPQKICWTDHLPMKSGLGTLEHRLG